jgi:hypothetical protein
MQISSGTITRIRGGNVKEMNNTSLPPTDEEPLNE